MTTLKKRLDDNDDEETPWTKKQSDFKRSKEMCSKEKSHGNSGGISRSDHVNKETEICNPQREKDIARKYR